MTVRENPLAEIPFNTNASIRPSDILNFTITNADNSKRIDITAAIAEFFYYESILSNTISATVVVMDSGFLGDENSPENNDGSQKGLKTKGLLAFLNLNGGERVDFKIKHSNIKVQGSDSVLEIPDGMYINRIRDVENNSFKDTFILDLVPKEFISNEKTRVVKRYDGIISDSITNILGDAKILGTNLPVTVNKTANSYNFIGNDRKPFYICTWLASKSIPEGKDENGKQITGGGAGYLFYQTRDRFHFRAIDKLLSPLDTDPVTGDKIRKYLYNNTGKNPNINFTDEADANILTYSVNKTIDVAKDLSMGTYNNRSIFFDPFSMSYKVNLFNYEDQVVNYFGTYRNIPKVPNITDSPTRLMSHVLDVGTMPNGSTSDQQLKTWKQDLTETNYNAEDIMVQSIMRYNQLFSIQVNVTIPGDFSIKAGDRILCKFMDLMQDETANNNLSAIYMVSSVCHKVTSEDTFSSLDLVADSYGTTRLKLTGNSFLN